MSLDTTETIEKARVSEVVISRLVSYIEERSNKLDDECALHDGNKQMQSIIAGQLLELEALNQAIQRGFFSFSQH